MAELINSIKINTKDLVEIEEHHHDLPWSRGPQKKTVLVTSVNNGSDGYIEINYVTERSQVLQLSGAYIIKGHLCGNSVVTDQVVEFSQVGEGRATVISLPLGEGD